ncbi:MAG: hypothetical protein ROO73_01405 [Roseivirga sp.]
MGYLTAQALDAQTLPQSAAKIIESQIIDQTASPYRAAEIIESQLGDRAAPPHGAEIILGYLDLANDPEAATKLQPTYQALSQKIQCRPGNNTHPDFVGIQGMKEALRNKENETSGTFGKKGCGSLSKFKAWTEAEAWGQFGPKYSHYGWWMFPIDRVTKDGGYRYAVFKEDIEALKADEAWLRDYRLAVILLMYSWGWDIKGCQCCANPGPEQQWRHWDIRLDKLTNSLILFEQWDLYESLMAYVKTLHDQGVHLEERLLRYFPPYL